MSTANVSSMILPDRSIHASDSAFQEQIYHSFYIPSYYFSSAQLLSDAFVQQTSAGNEKQIQPN